MKITQFDDTYTLKLAAGETTLVGGSSGGSNSGFGGDVTGSWGDLTVIGLRQRVSLSSNLAPSPAVGNVLTLISAGATPVAQFAVSSNSGGSGGVIVQDEGTPLATTLDFVGAGVTATGAGATKTITIPGGGGSGSFVWLATFTASASATLDLTGFISGTYTNYYFVVQNLVPATNNVDLYMRVGTGGGPTYDATANIYNSAVQAHVSGASVNSGGLADRMVVRGTSEIVNTASKGGVSGTVLLFNPASGAIETRMHGDFSYWTTQAVRTEMSAQYISTTAVTAFRFLFSSGNIASGIVRVYGITNS